MDVLESRAKEAHSIIYKFMLKNHVPYEDYSYSDFANYIIDHYSIKYKKVDFGPVLGQDMSGLIVSDKKTWVIHVNDKMLNTRQNFTMCHEIAHFIWDCSFGIEAKAYKSVIGNEYSDKNDVERLADMAAGVFMIPDICIIDSFKKGLSFNRIARKYKISHAALKYRLIQFILLNLNAPGHMIKEVTSAVEKFIYTSDPEDYLFYLRDDVFGTTRRVSQEFFNASLYQL